MAIAVQIAGVVLLFTGRYLPAIYDFVAAQLFDRAPGAYEGPGALEEHEPPLRLVEHVRGKN